MRNLRNSKGFTLIELMIVVVIIGILAAIAIPKFTSVSKSAKEAEADPILKQAFSLQESYLQKNEVYAATDAELGTLGWTGPQVGKYYSVSVKSGGTNAAFCVEATPAGEGVAAKANVTVKSIRQDRVVTNTAC